MLLKATARTSVEETQNSLYAREGYSDSKQTCSARLLVTELGLVRVELAEISVDRRRGAELHSRAQVVPAPVAHLAVAAGHPGLDGHAVTDLHVGDVAAHQLDAAGALVADDHRAV